MRLFSSETAIRATGFCIPLPNNGTVKIFENISLGLCFVSNLEILLLLRT